MAPFLDAHMCSVLLEFLGENKVYDAAQISRERIKCVSNSNMINFIEDEYKNFSEDSAERAEYESKKEYLQQRTDAIFKIIDNPSPEVLKVSEFFKNDSVVADLKSADKLNLETLSTKYNISSDDLALYFQNAKFHYECGTYAEAGTMISNYLLVSQPTSPTTVSALWGRLACHIVQGFWEPSKDDLRALKEVIEVRNTTPMEQLRQRAWILHWSLFVHFTQRDSFDSFLEFACDRVYTQTIQNMCPWLLRYFVVAALLSSRRKAILKDILNDIKNTAYLYSDPILSFVSTLYLEFDIDATQQKLKESLLIMKNDFFLCLHADKFADMAKMLMCEMYCTLYARVELKALADKLEVCEDDAEKWMVSMVQNNGVSTVTTNEESDGTGAVTGVSTVLSSMVLDARIDSSKQQVIIAPPAQNVYQQVVDRTRDLTARSTMLHTNMNTLLQEQGILLKNR